MKLSTRDMVKIKTPQAPALHNEIHDFWVPQKLENFYGLVKRLR
jgi:hypothetical protein